MPQAHLARIPRYTLVALFCALIHNLVLIGMDAMGSGVFLCQAASAMVLLPVGFLLQSRFTFAIDRSLNGFMRYSFALITNFPVALLVLWVMRDLVSLPMVIVAPLSSIVLFVWNYLTSSWAFGPTRQHSEGRPFHG